MTNQPPEYKRVSQYPFKYNGNVLWPIIFMIVFPPIGLLFLLFNLTIRHEGVYYGLKYKGSENWFIFWTIVFFPVAVLLGFLNGFDVIALESGDN